MELLEKQFRVFRLIKDVNADYLFWHQPTYSLIATRFQKNTMNVESNLIWCWTVRQIKHELFRPEQILSENEEFSTESLSLFENGFSAVNPRKNELVILNIEYGSLCI